MPEPIKKQPSVFDNVNTSKVAGKLVSNIPVYNPEDYKGKLDLRSSTLYEGVPASIINDPNSEQYLNELKAQRQSTLDKFANGTLQAANTAVVGTIGNTAGVVHGLANFANGESFFDNSTFKFMDDWDEKVKETLPLYRSQKEQTGDLGDKILDKDFIFGDLFQGLGFVASSVIPGIGWAKAGKAARSAILYNKLNRLQDLASKGLSSSDEFLKLSNFIKTTDNIIGGASNLGAATMGRIYESRLEAKEVYDETYNSSYDKKLEELKGTLPDDQAINEATQYATKQATDARNFTFGANMLLAIPDYYQYSKLFSNIANKANTVSKIASNTASDILESTPKSFLGKTSKTLGKVLNNDAVLIAGTEALEEGTQYNIAEASKKLAEKDYAFNISNYVNEFINESVKNISSPEFLASTLAGALIGGGMNLIGDSRNTNEPNVKNAIQDTNPNAELVKKTEVAKDNTSKFVQLEQDKTKLIEKISDKNTPEEEKIKAEVSYRQVNNLQFAQTVKQNIESDNIDNYLLEIEALGNNSKEQTSNDFGVNTSEYHSDGKEITPKDIADKNIKRAKKQASIYNDIQTKYTNLSQVSKDELYNILSTQDFNTEKLNVVNNKITELKLEKDNHELSDIPFTADKQSTLDNLNKEKEILANSQKELDSRFIEIKNNKNDNRVIKSKDTNNLSKIPIVNPKQDIEKAPIENIIPHENSKYKGEIEVLSKNKFPSSNRITFRVKGNNTKVILSENEFNKQVLGINNNANTNKENLNTKNNLVKEDSEDLPLDTEEYNIDDLDSIIEKANKQITKEPNKPRKALGTSTFFNSPLFFGVNSSTENRNEILSKPNWKDNFRIKLSKEYAKDSKEEVAYTEGNVKVYKNGGNNALDIIIQYKDQEGNWLNYGSLPYIGMLRDAKGQPYDFSLMPYQEFKDKFFIKSIEDSTGVNQNIEFTPEQFDLLKIQQSIFKEFEELTKQFYNNSSQSEIVLPNTAIDYRLSYFINTGESSLSELINNTKVLVISDGKINKELTNTTKRESLPSSLLETYGTSNKTFVNIEFPNGTSFWTISYVKGNNKKIESEIINKLSDLAINYNTIEVNPENDLLVNNIIKDINSIVFINNNLENYLNFRAFPLENKKGYKIKVQLKTDNGPKYIDIFNPITTIKEDGTNLLKEELNNYFNFDNLSNLINNGFKEYSININPNSFISNYTKGNPKLEDLAIPISSIDYNIKFEYNIKELPTLTNSITLDKSTSPDIDKDIEREVEEQKAKLINKKKTSFSKELNTGFNTKEITKKELTNIVSRFKSQYNLNVLLEPIFDSNNKPVKGKFENGNVYLNPEYITQDTPIHEVLHPFIELIKDKNPLLYNTLIKELKKSDIGKKVISLVKDNYINSSEEEILDESLVTLMGYYASGVIPSSEKNLLGTIKAFFKKIASYIKNIFNKDLDPYNIATSTTISELSNIVVNTNVDLNRVNVKNTKEAKLDLLGANDSIKLINTIGAKVVQRITIKPNKENLSSLIGNIIDQTRLENNTRNINADNIQNLEERKTYKLKRHLIYEALTIPENIESIKKSITEDILKMQYSEETTYSEEDDTVQNINDEADIKDYEEGVENSGGWNNIDPEIRNFIYYNTYTYIDEAGYEVTEAIDGINIYKSIQSALADQNPDNFINILESLSNYSIQLKSVLDNFKIKIGLDSQGNKTLEQSNFYNKFFKAFENSKLEYIQVFANKDGEFVASSANRSTGTGRIFNKWKNNFISNKDTLNINADKLQKVLNDIGSEVIVKPNDIINNLYSSLNNLGIDLSKAYLEYSFIPESSFKVFEAQGITKFDFDTLNKILSSIKKGNDIFESGTKGNTNILYKIAEADAIFKEDSIEDTYRDSRGKLRNSYTKQNLITKSINKWKEKVQDSGFIKDIKEDKNNYYHYNYLFNNRLFNSNSQLQEVFKNANLALIGDIRLIEDKQDKKYTTRNISSSAFSKMQIALYKNSTEPKDIIDNSNFKFDPRTNSRQKFAYIDFGKISDKNTEVALRLPIDDRFYDKGFTDWYIEQVYNTIFLQEYNKLKNYDTKERLYYSKEYPLILNPKVINDNKSGNGWLNLSIFNNKVLDEVGNIEYLQLKDLTKIEDLSTKKELIKKYIKESFNTSFEEYKNILASEKSLNKGSEKELTDLGNIYANNYLLRTSFQQLVKGDLAISKDTDDDLKRNGRVTAYGDSGIDFTNEKSSTYKVLYMTEAIRYKVKENNNFREATESEIKDFKEDKSNLDIVEINSDDAGVRMTVRHLIETLQRLGRVDRKTLMALNKIDNGEKLTNQELNLIDLVPLKGVHGGLDRYFKMSQFTLIKEFTSTKDKDGNWVARKGREELHNLRVLMETNNVGLAIPKSASKSISLPQFNQNLLKQDIDPSNHNIENNSEDISWQDWRLQVENESGKTEISQPVQILQMIDGSSKVPQSVKEELQKLYEEQRIDNFTNALDIATGDTSFGKQELIDKFYDNAINSSSDANTLEYLSGENGEFTYNPNLPHITFTFENYYTSHFNKNVLAQKVPGYKCTLAPATGIKLLRNTQTGEIIRSDVYESNKKDYNSKEYQLSDLRIHSKESPYAECLMTKSQAKKLNINIGESIDQDIFKMVGTRLPCQGYSSMIPLKIVDFLPECYGSTIIAPEEIVYIAGSDYDVDSLFIMRKEAYNDKNNNIRYYTYNEPNNDLRWQDYKNYLLTSNKNITSKLSKQKDLSIEEVLKGYNYPSTKEEFLTKEKELGHLLNSKAAITNKIVTVYETILTDPNLLDDLQQPVTNSGFDTIAKTIYFDLFKQGSKVNYFHNSDKALKKHFELATQGKRDVGPAAIGNSTNSFFKKHNIILKETYHFTFNSKPVTNVHKENVIDFDFIYDKRGKPIIENGIPLTSEIKEVSKQEVLSGLMSITVDNQKDPVCFMLNLDPTNVGIASTMIHLGIGGKGFIASFMHSVPIKNKLSSRDYSVKGYMNIVNKEVLIKSMMGIASDFENASIALLNERLQKISASTFNVSVLIATNKGIGSTFEDLDKIKSAQKAIENPNTNVFSNIEQAIKDNKNLSFNLKSIDTINEQVLSKEFLSRSEFMTDLKEFLDKSTSPDINLDKDFSGYLISNILKHNRNVNFNEVTELALPNNPNSIVSKYFDLLKNNKEFKNNILIKFLTIERGNSLKPDLLYFNQSIKLNGKSLEKLTDGYRELLQSDNEEVSNFAKDMFYYLIIKDNMKFTINSFSRLLAPEVFKDISKELKTAIDAITSKDNDKLKELTGKNYKELTSDFIHTYLRWIGNTDKYINYHTNKLKSSGIISKRNIDRDLILNFNNDKVDPNKNLVFNSYQKDNNTFLYYPEFIKSGTTVYYLKESDGINAKYTPISYIGLPIISPYHLSLSMNEELYNNRRTILSVKKFIQEENNDDIVPDIDLFTSSIGDTEAIKPEEYIQDNEDIVSENDIFGILNEPSNEELGLSTIEKQLENTNQESKNTTNKPSDSLEKAVEQNITQYFEDFYYSLDSEQKGKLANIGTPRLITPLDLIKDYNKSKEQYNNNFNKYLEYIKNCRT